MDNNKNLSVLVCQRATRNLVNQSQLSSLSPHDSWGRCSGIALCTWYRQHAHLSLTRFKSILYLKSINSSPLIKHGIHSIIWASLLPESCNSLLQHRLPILLSLLAPGLGSLLATGGPTTTSWCLDSLPRWFVCGPALLASLTLGGWPSTDRDPGLVSCR